MRMDIMVDIETLGTKSDSTIIQLSAVAFDIRTGEQLHTFNQVADITKNEQPLQVTGSTLQWWMKTNKELFATLLTEGKESSEDVLRAFHAWVIGLAKDPKELYLWGNGILFDNKMIQHQLENLGLSYPIFYRNDRDVRTLLELASVKMGISEQEIRERVQKKERVAHNAFDDVLNQIDLVVYCYDDIVLGW